MYDRFCNIPQQQLWPNNITPPSAALTPELRCVASIALTIVVMTHGLQHVHVHPHMNTKLLSMTFNSFQLGGQCWSCTLRDSLQRSHCPHDHFCSDMSSAILRPWNSTELYSKPAVHQDLHKVLIEVLVSHRPSTSEKIESTAPCYTLGLLNKLQPECKLSNAA